MVPWLPRRNRKWTAWPRPNPYAAKCATRLVLDRIADKWTVLVMGLLDSGPVRFNQLRREVEGLSQKVLSQTLRRMERDGLITRTAHPTVPVTVEYALTPLGRTLASTLAPLRAWAENHIQEVLRAQRTYDTRPDRDRTERSLGGNRALRSGRF